MKPFLLTALAYKQQHSTCEQLLAPLSPVGSVRQFDGAVWWIWAHQHWRDYWGAPSVHWACACGGGFTSPLNHCQIYVKLSRGKNSTIVLTVRERAKQLSRGVTIDWQGGECQELGSLMTPCCSSLRSLTAQSSSAMLLHPLSGFLLCVFLTY